MWMNLMYHAKYNIQCVFMWSQKIWLHSMIDRAPMHSKSDMDCYCVIWTGSTWYTRTANIFFDKIRCRVHSRLAILIRTYWDDVYLKSLTNRWARRMFQIAKFIILVSTFYLSDTSMMQCINENSCDGEMDLVFIHLLEYTMKVIHMYRIC